VVQEHFVSEWNRFSTLFKIVLIEEDDKGLLEYAEFHHVESR